MILEGPANAWGDMQLLGDGEAVFVEAGFCCFAHFQNQVQQALGTDLIDWAYGTVIDNYGNILTASSSQGFFSPAINTGFRNNFLYLVPPPQ